MRVAVRTLMFSLVALTTLVAQSGRASFLGNPISVRWHFPTYPEILEAHEVVVGPDVEFPPLALENANLVIDIGADSILFRSGGEADWLDVSVNGFEFVDSTGSIDRIVGFTIGEIDGVVSGLDPEDLSFTDDSVFINFGASGPTGTNFWERNPFGYTSVSFNIVFVPEPASGLLLATGLGLLALARQRRRPLLSRPHLALPDEPCQRPG